MAFRVLIVCTANLCRSPLAEHVLRDRLADRYPDWEIVSAGTRAVDGRGMHPRIADILARRGIAHRSWTSTRLTVADVDAADLVLTAEAAHRAAVVVARPAAVARTFTLRQFAGLCTSVPGVATDPDPGASLVDGARRARSAVSAIVAEENITDPMGGRRRAFERCARLMDSVMSDIARPLVSDG